jgi:hypothetical protein
VGLDEVHLSVLTSDDVAVRLYARTGFAVVSSDDTRYHMRAIVH